MSNSLHPHGLYSLGDSPGQNTGVGSFFLLQGIFPTQELSPAPALQVDSLPVEPQGNPKNIGVGSLSLLQRIFPTQESNRGLRHCRQILYQLSYEWSPYEGVYKKDKKYDLYLPVVRNKPTYYWEMKFEISSTFLKVFQKYSTWIFRIVVKSCMSNLSSQNHHVHQPPERLAVTVEFSHLKNSRKMSWCKV